MAGKRNKRGRLSILYCCLVKEMLNLRQKIVVFTVTCHEKEWVSRLRFYFMYFLWTQMHIFGCHYASPALILYLYMKKESWNYWDQKKLYVCFRFPDFFFFFFCGWLGRVMVLGSFQCWGVLLLRHIVGQGSAVLAAGVGWMGCFCGFSSSHLSYLSFCNASSLGWRLDILKYYDLVHYNPTVVVSYCRRRAR